MHAAASVVHPARTPAPGRYRVDPARTTIRFRARHMFGLGVVRGEVNVLSGHVDVAESLNDSVFQAVMSAESIDTGHPTRDRMVRSATYLDVASHPTITFAANGVHSEDGQWVVEGSLEARGVTAPVRLTIDSVEVGAESIRVHATTRVDRYAHGVKAGRGIAGRRLAVDITAELTRC
jgi:polyisoprenoid-binding protein YceI